MSTKNVDSSKKFICLSFCTGYGGIELGVRRVIPTLRTIAYVEIETFAVANLVAKIEEGKLDAAPIWTNLKTFNAHPFRNKVDIVVGGYPCQPFSVAGKRKGEDDERHLWPFIRDHIQQIRPLYCFFENVAGHLRLGFDRVFRDLDELGYTVEADLFTASEVGAPHKRERLFILAHARYDVRTSRGQGSRSGELETAAGGEGGTGNQQAVSLECSGELGNTERCGLSGDTRRGASDKPRVQEAENGSDSQERSDAAGNTGGILGTNGESREELDNPLLRRHGHEDKEVRTGGNGTVNASKLADTIDGRSQVGRPEVDGKASGRNLQNNGAAATELCHISPPNRWPARPGQEQCDWEEPRTVESGMGRTVDGFRSRVDELRLLGNGVVPAQAELAFRTLMEKLTNAVG